MSTCWANETRLPRVFVFRINTYLALWYSQITWFVMGQMISKIGLVDAEITSLQPRYLCSIGRSVLTGIWALVNLWKHYYILYNNNNLIRLLYFVFKDNLSDFEVVISSGDVVVGRCLSTSSSKYSQTSREPPLSVAHLSLDKDKLRPMYEVNYLINTCVKLISPDVYRTMYLFILLFANHD